MTTLTLDDASTDLREIIALRAQNKRLRAALERSLSWLQNYPGGNALRAYDQARTAAEEPPV